MKTTVGLVLTLVLFLLPLAALAQTPAYIPVQGFLTDQAGNALDGSFDLKFVLYDSLEEGNSLFEESHLKEDVQAGFFVVYLGSSDTLDLGLFRDHGEVFLGITIGSEAEMTPRLVIGSTPFAAFAQFAGLAQDAQAVGGVAATELQQKTKGLLALQLEMDEGVDQRVFHDSSGLGNHATSLGSLAGGTVGHTNNAVDLSGGMIAVAEGNTIPDSSQVWVEVWIRPDELDGRRNILTKVGSYTLAQVDDQIVFEVYGQRGPGDTCQAQAGSLKTLEWIHVAGWYNGLEVAASINGRHIVAPCQVGPLAASLGDPFYIGSLEYDADGSDRFVGAIDELRVRLTAPVKLERRRNFFAYSQVDNMNDGSDPTNPLSISVNYQKKYADSLLRLTFSSNLYTGGDAGHCCRWEIRVNDANCSPTVSGNVYIKPAGSYHQHRTITGICKGIDAGPITVQPWVTECPGYSVFDCYTGWQSMTSLEVEEIF